LPDSEQVDRLLQELVRTLERRTIVTIDSLSSLGGQAIDTSETAAMKNMHLRVGLKFKLRKDPGPQWRHLTAQQLEQQEIIIIRFRRGYVWFNRLDGHQDGHQRVHNHSRDIGSFKRDMINFGWEIVN